MRQVGYSRIRVKVFFKISDKEIEKLNITYISYNTAERKKRGNNEIYKITFISFEEYDDAIEGVAQLKCFITKEIREIYDKWTENNSRKRPDLKKQLNKRVDNKNKLLELVKIIDGNKNFTNSKEYKDFLKNLIKFIPLTRSIEGYNSLWNEYKYRHDLIWKFLFKVIVATAAVVVIPYTKYYIKYALDDRAFKILVFIPLGILIISSLVIINEMDLLGLIRRKYRSYQESFFHIEHGKTLISRYIKFKYLVRIFLFLSFVLTLASGIYGGWHQSKLDTDKQVSSSISKICQDSNTSLCGEIVKDIRNYGNPITTTQVKKAVSEYCEGESVSECNKLKNYFQNFNKIIRKERGSSQNRD